MKYVFVMNPTSGKKKKRTEFIKQLEMTAERLHISYDIYFTKASGDGKRYVRELCEECMEKGEKLRIYGCGGDGTINELVNGVFGYQNVEIGAIPMGTGNDYVRNYGSVSDFLNLKNQIQGESRYSDLIHYRAEYNGNVTEGYCVNMFNIGFDCNVVDLTATVKNWPLLNGSLAYLVSVAIILFKKEGADVRIQYEDGTVVDGKILLVAIANGCYCGGGVKGVPYCRLDDGRMDVSVINNVTRRFFASMFPSYARGTHMTKKKIKNNDVIRYTKERVLTITANGESLRLCTDGEITTQKKIEFSVVKDAFKFIVPSDAASI